MLIVARIVQGAGAAGLMPSSRALIAHTFPDTHDRRRPLAVWGGASGIGLASGPVLGGVLTAAVGWRAIFLVRAFGLPPDRRFRGGCDGRLSAIPFCPLSLSIEIRETHRVHEHAASAIIRARKPAAAH